MNSLEAFFYVHEGLARQGPGSKETSQALYEAAATECDIRTAVDLGAGPGASAVFLARQGVNVTAVDKNVDFLSQLAARAAKVGVSQRIRVLNESMAAVDAIGGPFDLLWSEGTAYILGLSRALSLWSRLMKPESCLVLTDAFWLTNERSAGAVDFWSTEPNMLHVDDAPALFSRLGFAVTHQPLTSSSNRHLTGWMSTTTR